MTVAKLTDPAAAARLAALIAPAIARAQAALPAKQRTGTVATARPSEESRRAPITPDALRPAG